MMGPYASACHYCKQHFAQLPTSNKVEHFTRQIKTWRCLPVMNVEVEFPAVTTAGVAAETTGDDTAVTAPATLVTIGVSNPVAGEVVFTTAPTKAPA